MVTLPQRLATANKGADSLDKLLTCIVGAATLLAKNEKVPGAVDHHASMELYIAEVKDKYVLKTDLTTLPQYVLEDMLAIARKHHSVYCMSWARPGDNSEAYCDCNVQDITAALTAYCIGEGEKL